LQEFEGTSLKEFMEISPISQHWAVIAEQTIDEATNCKQYWSAQLDTKQKGAGNYITHSFQSINLLPDFYQYWYCGEAKATKVQLRDAASTNKFNMLEYKVGENDCNQWAKEYLSKFGLDVEQHITLKDFQESLV
jgi:hypothetical protein